MPHDDIFLNKHGDDYVQDKEMTDYSIEDEIESSPGLIIEFGLIIDSNCINGIVPINSNRFFSLKGIYMIGSHPELLATINNKSIALKISSKLKSGFIQSPPKSIQSNFVVIFPISSSVICLQE